MMLLLSLLKQRLSTSTSNLWISICHFSVSYIPDFAGLQVALDIFDVMTPRQSNKAIIIQTIQA